MYRSRNEEGSWRRPRSLGVRAAPSCVLLLTLATPASAADPGASSFNDPYDLPETPRPPTLPELTHPGVEATTESTAGILTPPRGSDVVSVVQRFNFEVPFNARRWFLGATYEFAGGEPPGGGIPKAVGGNLELYGRTVWATRTGLACGGGFGLVIPAAVYGRSGDAENTARAAATLRPWDDPFFEEGFATLRPFFDVRDIDGRFVLQFRQGLDLAFDVTDLPTYRVAALSALYAGYLIGPVGVGVEAFEYYFIDAPVADDKRGVFLLSPSLRFLFPYVQPAVSAITNVATPLSGNVDHFWGIRLAATIVWDTATRGLERDREAHPSASGAGGAEPSVDVR